MTSYTTTAHGLALLGNPRARQSVHRVVSTYGHGSARHIVLVVPDGSETGEYYEVGEHALAALMDGASPEWLELEPCDGQSEDDEPDFTAADRRELMARSGAFGRD